MPRMEQDASPAQAPKPGAQQRRGLKIDRENPSRTAYEGFDAQIVHPSAQIARPERGDNWFQPFAGEAIAAEERLGGFGVCQVQPAFPGHQEFSAHGRHGVEDMDGCARFGCRLCRHQSGGATADNGHDSGWHDFYRSTSQAVAPMPNMKQYIAKGRIILSSVVLK
jgi:hypothetical protein